MHFFFPIQVQAGFLPHGPTSSCDAAGLLKPWGCGQAASCRAGLQTSSPSAWQQLRLWHGFGTGVKSGWEPFSQRCAFPASLAQSRASPVAGQPLPRALFRSTGCVQNTVVRDSFELLLSYLAPKPQPRSQTRCSPAFPLRGACVGRQALLGARKRAAGEGGRILPFSFHG